jgi:hypothetical protein
LSIQGAALSVSTATLAPIPVSSTLRKPFCEALLEAADAETWRSNLTHITARTRMLVISQHHTSGRHPTTECRLPSKRQQLFRTPSSAYAPCTTCAMLCRTSVAVMIKYWHFMPHVARFAIPGHSPCHRRQRTPGNQPRLPVFCVRILVLKNIYFDIQFSTFSISIRRAVMRRVVTRREARNTL